VATTTERIQDLLNRPGGRPSLATGERVELRLDSGEVIGATIAMPGTRSDGATRIAARSKSWTRWAGTPDDLLTFLKKASAEIAKRSAETPTVSICVYLSGADEERYFEIEAFESEILSTDSGTPGARLRDIQAIEITIGPTRKGDFKVNATFKRIAPGVVLSLEGADRPVVSGLKDELAPTIDSGRPRIPALPGPAEMLVGGLAGFAYFLGFTRVNWDFMPGGAIGQILLVLLYLSGFIALIYSLTAGLRSLLPPFALARKGEKTPSQQWGLRVAKVGGPLALAVLPFVLERAFGG
jgi:hypothetical protein